ncbi:MAG TPA: type I DNA topoisomerase [Actinomycetes bacterium]|nr:type I DNA topoisomerase [Actinomycetes bacterium]
MANASIEHEDIGLTRNLVVVESPAKAKTIGKYLGKDYDVVASMGHVRDLPKSDFAVDINGGVTVTYEVTPKGKKVVSSIRKAAKSADLVFLATDPDREGEAIAWHIAEAAKLAAGSLRRVTFTEITADAVRRAFADPRDIDDRLVDAYRARRVVDRIVGYKLSPVLWRKVRAGLSAGRVQSAALKMIVDREREIEAFHPQEYWSLEADLATDADEAVHARYPVGEKQKFVLGDEGAAAAAADRARAATWVVADVNKSERRRSAAPPFITSTLQQEAARKLNFSSKRTMALAQQLYEGVDLPGEGSVGLITYMRTDSPALSQAALNEIAGLVGERYGRQYVKTTQYKARAKTAQEAHEAIRPTVVARTPESLTGHLEPAALRLYELVWKRAVASQMAQAVYDQTSVDIAAGDLTFRATGSVLRFDGFVRVYLEGRDDDVEEEAGTLPELTVGQVLRLLELRPEQHFTEPPPRYTEASLVKALEEHGIGRPSTYSPTISTLLDRKYVRQERKRFHPEDVGMVVTDLLADVFPKVIDLGFTAEMEEDLDRIASGAKPWEPVVKTFFAEVEGTIAERQEKVSRPEEATDETCPECGAETGAKLVRKWGRYGWFLSCSRYPDCKYRRNARQSAEQAAERAEPELTDVPCPKCGKPMVRRSGRFGPFLGCSDYPKCRGIKNLGEQSFGTCPKCGEGEVVSKRTKRGKTFYSCNRYPDCDFALWQAPLEQPCPSCGGLLALDRDPDTATCAKCGSQVRVAELVSA